MTVRVTTLKGAETGRYYTERLPGYYLDGGEPPGRWWGKAVGRLGLSGQLEPEEFLAVMAGQHPSSRRDLGRRYGEKSARGYDATFSAPKSVSVLFALGDKETRQQIIDGHERAVEAVLEWVEDHAHTRITRHGHITHVDAQGVVVGMFRQHTSRRLDPQLHTHAVIANRVPAPDGRWLALDARTIKVDQRTLSALYHAGLRSELTGRLGVEWEAPEHGIAEIAGIPDEVLAEFSQRTADIEQRLAEKLTRFRLDMGRDPTAKEHWRMEREAVLDSRPGKPPSPSLAELHEQWRRRAHAIRIHPQQLVKKVIGRRRRLHGIGHAVASAIASEGVEALVERQSSWRPAELVRELATVVPTSASVDADQLTGLLQSLADDAAETRCMDISRPVLVGATLRRDGRPVTEAAADRALTTRAILDEEEQLLAWARRRLEPNPRHVHHRPERDHDLSVGQAAIVAAVAGRRGLELIVGPAGAGKTTTLSTAVQALHAQGRPTYGVTPTATAAEVLAAETGMAADTVDKLLTEHHHSTRPPLPEYDLRAGTTVIVDEAATAATPKLAELTRLADRHAWRIILVGDPRQFSAVGRGGMFSHLVDLHGAIELDQVHRFHHQWERQASLRLRTGEPDVLHAYHRWGRLHGGSLEEMETDIVTAWKEGRVGGEMVALMANSTETVARLNQLAQQTRILANDLEVTGPRLRVGSQRLLVGDYVVTRRNNRRLRTDIGVMVKNRDHWTITNIHRDQSVTVTGSTGTVRLPANYVAENLELGYAQTSYATQGRTVDTALLLIDSPTDSHGVYTPMTRGREANHAYIVTEENQTPVDALTQAITRDWIDQPAVARRQQLHAGIYPTSVGISGNAWRSDRQVPEVMERGRRRESIRELSL